MYERRPPLPLGEGRGEGIVLLLFLKHTLILTFSQGEKE